MIWFVLFVFTPIVVGSCWLSVRMWRGRSVRGVEVSDFDVMMLGETAKDGGAASFPAGNFALAFGLAWALLDHFFYPYGAAWLETLAHALIVISGVLLVCSITLLLFMQPWFLVPPTLRGRHGYVVASWRGLRARRVSPRGRHES